MKVSKTVWLRLAMIVFAAVNQILIAINKPVLPISDGDAEVVFNTVINIVFMIIGFWKNNSFTSHAKQADEYMKKIK